MQIVAFSDYRVQNIDLLEKFIEHHGFIPDLILYAGDDLSRFIELDGSRESVLVDHFERLAELSKYGLCLVRGNDDSGHVNKYIKGTKVFDVHRDPLIIGEYAVIGIEGAIYEPAQPDNAIGFTLNSEQGVKKHLETMKKIVGANKSLIIVSHTPPRNVLDFAVRFGQRHVGSNSLRGFLEKNSKTVPLVVCGHVHINGGKHELLKNTTVVNAASHDYEGAPGRVALISILDGQRRQWDDRVFISWQEVQNKLRLYGVGAAKEAKLAAAGIHRVEHILSFSPEQLCQRIGCSLNTAQSLHLRAKSMVERKTIALKPLIELDVENPIFLDIETDLTQSLVWLVGVYFLKKDKFVQYFAERPKDEKAMLTKFLSEMKQSDKGTMYIFSGTYFDERVLKKRMAHHGLDYSGLSPFVDLCIDIRKSVIFPLHSYGLKHLARYFGYNYRHPDLDGISVATAYLGSYQRERNKQLLKVLKEYNEDDVKSLPVIVSKIAEIAGTIKITRIITETVVETELEIPEDEDELLAVVARYYRQCGSLLEKARGTELRFRTRSPTEISEIRKVMAALGFEAGRYQQYNNRAYLPFYGRKLRSLVRRIAT